MRRSEKQSAHSLEHRVSGKAVVEQPDGPARLSDEQSKGGNRNADDQRLAYQILHKGDPAVDDAESCADFGAYVRRLSTLQLRLHHQSLAPRGQLFDVGIHR